MDGITDWGTLILGVSVFVSTLTYNFRQSKLAKDKMSKELFTEFNTRYSILNGPLEIAVQYQTIEQLLNSNDSGCLDDIYDFFDLCAEEYYWNTKKRINKEIWSCWHAGMNRWYSNHAIIRETWDLQIQNFGKVSFYIEENDKGFFN